MPNMTVTNLDLGSVELRDGKFRDATLVFAGADTLAPGTLLARRTVALAVVASAITGTGTGTVTAASVAPGAVVPRAGVYTLRCTEAVANGGVFRLEDPDGAIIATGLRLTAGAGTATIFEVAGFLFTITDAGTDFAVGDTATLTVAADGRYLPFATAGAGGAQIPSAVLTYEVVAEGAGDVPARLLITGEVNRNRLIIDADGDGDNITTTILDQLRAVGIVAVDTQELALLDNQ